MMDRVLASFLESAIRTATPLALAALGELVVERAGMIDIGLEGIILAGAFGALVGADHGGVLAGFLASAGSGVLVALLFAAFTLWVRADQIITGTAITMLSLGATGTLYRTLYGAAGAALETPTSGPLALPGLSRIPFVGTALFDQPPITYGAYLLVPVLWWWMYRTHAGLALRAVGESPAVARAAGVRVARVRLAALLFSGITGGIAGGMLVLAQAGTFAEGMSAGRGFVALAIVVLGRWHPIGVAFAALLFGSATALQFILQALGLALPYQLFLAFPYVLTLAALAGVAGRADPPAALAKLESDSA
ncbi:MAG TPA: ABC transporter permease [Gemmatimonadaceae bacterium]|nr:ABC transporter permease [Gemmatimonadaceae bacterium]